VARAARAEAHKIFVPQARISFMPTCSACNKFINTGCIACIAEFPLLWGCCAVTLNVDLTGLIHIQILIVIVVLE
jgi:hypothetical protein